MGKFDLQNIIRRLEEELGARRAEDGSGSGGVKVEEDGVLVERQSTGNSIWLYAFPTDKLNLG